MTSERAQRKYTSWTSHIGWGACLVLAADLQTDLGWALLASIILGFAWEIGWATMANPRKPEDRASVGDLCAWIVGAVLGALLSICWSN